jgi:hypothetical protein
MALSLKWTRRTFLSNVAFVGGAMVDPRKLFADSAATRAA